MTPAQRFAYLKLMEECAELIMVTAKLGRFPDGNHPSRKFDGPLWPEIADEIADVRAACTFFLQKFPEVPIAGLESRKQEKLELYEKYAAEDQDE